MADYIDGFVFPIPRANLAEYTRVAAAVAEIWKAYGATAYCEFGGDDLKLAGTKSFAELLDCKSSELVIFGWVSFPSKAVRDEANRQVATDPRMEQLVAPLLSGEPVIFDASRMAYGGFKALTSTGED